MKTISLKNGKWLEIQHNALTWITVYDRPTSYDREILISFRKDELKELIDELQSIYSKIP